MKMPFSEAAYVPILKVTDYLLSETHPRGSIKAAWFRTYGFSSQKPEQLAQALTAHANHDVWATEETPYGVKYSIKGTMACPNDQQANLLSLWIILKDTKIPTFVTGYPSK
jgi:hypothetical protein